MYSGVLSLLLITEVQGQALREQCAFLGLVPSTRARQVCAPVTHGLGIPLSKVGFPIRISADQSSFAAPRGFSQRSTSFIASQRQGIHQMPLFHLIALIINAHPALGVRSRIRVCTLTGGTLIRKTSLQDRTDDSLRSGTEPTKHRARSFGSHEMPGVRTGRDLLQDHDRYSERSSLHDVRYHAPVAVS